MLSLLQANVGLQPLAPSWLIAAVSAGLAAYLGSYLRRKGENLATQKDIERITQQVEGVKHFFDTRLQRFSHDYGTFAIKRNEIYAEAYAALQRTVGGYVRVFGARPPRRF